MFEAHGDQLSGIRIDEAAIDSAQAALVDEIETLTGSTVQPAHLIDVLENGEEIFPAMLDAIRASTTTIDLLTYVYWSGFVADRFVNALEDAARRGVRVRFLLDAVGARGFDDAANNRLRSAGCDVRLFRRPTVANLPGLIHRTHRKLLICDGHIGFTGGVGIADEWDGDGKSENEWRDLHLRIEGPSVKAMTAAFVDNWVDEGGAAADWNESDVPGIRSEDGAHVAAISDSPEERVSRIHVLLGALFRDASTTITVATAYLNPTVDLCTELCAAARRGVRVDLIVPGSRIDKQISRIIAWGHYEDLLLAGVRLHEYQPSMYHAKAITVDGRVAVVGSPNLNRRSRSLDHETALVIIDAAVTARIDDALRVDIARSSVVDCDWPGHFEWRRRLGRLVSPLRPFA